MVIRKSEILVGENQGLSDYELMKAARRSRILKHYQSSGGISQRATSMQNTRRLESAETDRELREEFVV